MQMFINQSNEKLNKIAFELLDTNADGYISEVDLFVTLTMGKIFLDVLLINNKINDIILCFIIK